MRTLFGEFRYAARSLVRQPTFSIVAIATLVLGIGAITAIFSVIKAVLLNPLAYADPSRLVVLTERNPDGNPSPVSIPTYLDWREQVGALESIAAFRNVTYAFAGHGDPIDVQSVRGTPELFPLLGVEATLGRTFRPEEGQPGADHVAVLSHAFWQRQFGGSRSVIATTIQLDAQPYTVVGVMPPDFDFPPSAHIDIWTPLSFDPADQHGRSRRARVLSVVGRLRPGAGPDQAESALAVVSARLAAAYPDSNTGWGAHATSARDQLVTTVRPALTMISGAVAFLLLIVCANVANLMLARLSTRRTEIAVRTALGAGRLQIVRQVLAESVVLAAAGGALGVLIAWGGIRLVHALPEGSLPRMGDVKIDGGVLVFALTASIGASIVFGVLPALHASRAGLRDTVNAFSGVAGGSRHRLLGAFVVVEVALALVLLAGAGLMARSFMRLMHVSPGFEPRNLLAVQLYLPQTKYREGVERTRFYAAAIERVSALPGVQSAAAVSTLPMYPVGIDFALPFTIEGKAPSADGDEPRADVRIATPGYFQTMRMPLVSGRFIDERDRQGAPGAMVINETMARRYFAGETPVGRVVRNPHGRFEVVGVVGDVKHYALDADPRAELFLPAWQQPLPGMALVARTDSDPRAFIEPIRREVQAVDAEQPIFDATAMEDAVSRSVFLPRVSMVLLAAFATAALLLAVVGIYGVVSYSVAQRTRELGVRMALGADAGVTLRLVMGRSMALVAIGTICGLAAAIALTRVMSGLLYDVDPLDPGVFAGVSALLASAGFLASLVPARRATLVDPIVALRVE
jgi:putative ABC transport system permease protein